MDMRNWTSIQANGTEVVESNHGSAVLNVLDTDISSDLYFSAPQAYLGNILASHGGQLVYDLKVTPASDDATITVSADVKMKSGDVTLEYWATEQPSDPKESFMVTVELVHVS